METQVNHALDGLLDLLAEATVRRMQTQDQAPGFEVSEVTVPETPAASQEFNDDRAS